MKAAFRSVCPKGSLEDLSVQIRGGGAIFSNAIQSVPVKIDCRSLHLSVDTAQDRRRSQKDSWIPQ